MQVDVQLNDDELALLSGYSRSTTMGIKKPGELQRELLSDMENIEEKRMMSVPEVENASEDSTDEADDVMDDAPVRVRADFLSMLSELAKPDTNKAGINEDEDGYEDGDDGGILPDDDDEESDGDDGGILLDDDEGEEGNGESLPDDDDEEDDGDEDDWQGGVLPDDDEEDSQGIASEKETAGISLEDEDDSGELPEDEDEGDYELPEDEDDGDSELPEDEDDGDSGELPEDEDEELSEDEDEGDYELPEDEDEDDYDSEELPADEDEDEDASGELPEDASEELPEDDVEEAPESTEESTEPAPSRIAPVVAEKPASPVRRVQKVVRPVSKQSVGRPAGYSTPPASLYDFILSNGGSMLIEDVKKYYPIDEVKKALNLGKIYRFGNKVGV